MTQDTGKEAQEGVGRVLEVCGLLVLPFFGLGSVGRRSAGCSSAACLIYQVFTPVSGFQVILDDRTT